MGEGLKLFIDSEARKSGGPGSDKITYRLRLLTQWFIVTQNPIENCCTPFAENATPLVLSFSLCTIVQIKETPMEDMHPSTPQIVWLIQVYALQQLSAITNRYKIA